LNQSGISFKQSRYLKELLEGYGGTLMAEVGRNDSAFWANWTQWARAFVCESVGREVCEHVDNVSIPTAGIAIRTGSQRCALFSNYVRLMNPRNTNLLICRNYFKTISSTWPV